MRTRRDRGFRDVRDALCDEFNHFVTCARWVVRVESRSEAHPRALRTKTRLGAEETQGLGPERRRIKQEEREQKQSTTESLQQRTGRGRFDGRDVIASNKSVRVPIDRNVDRHRAFSFYRRQTPNPRPSSRRSTLPFSRVVYAPMLMDMSSASVLVSRIRLSSALWCASVLRIDITDQPKAAICARV